MSFEFRWIIGSIFAMVIAGAGLLVYGIIESNSSRAGPKATIDAGEGAVFKIDKWECMKGEDQRGAPYSYARNARNGATGPASLCKKVLEE
jgi:hypothetical protein